MDKKLRMNISVDPETNAKLREFAKTGHTTVSQWITDRVWEKVEEKETAERLIKQEMTNKGK